jgi:RHS repeat-associated protein
MQQFKKLNGVVGRFWSRQAIRVFISQLLIMVLCFGSAISQTLRAKSSENVRPVVLSAKPGPVVSRKPRPPFAARVQAISLLPGQSITQLPDGRSLLIGGELDNQGVDTVSISDARTGAPIELKARLHQARAWHSATLLPDGTVLVLGGIGKNGAILRSAEIFDPKTQIVTLLTTPGNMAKAYHTATLLTDGQVLITGGVGETLLWDFVTKTFRTLPEKPKASRQKHKATLLYDGNVLLEGGDDDNGKQVTIADLFSTNTGSFNFSSISSAQLEQTTPFLSGSFPADGATDISPDSLLALRFSKPLRVETLNFQTVILTGPRGKIDARIVPAEGGRLAFITAALPLDQGTTYTVSIGDALDESGTNITAGAVSFTTKGSSEPGSANSDGEDWIPNTGNLNGDWRSNRPDSPWQQLPSLEAAPGVTALAGQILLLNGNPLDHVTLQLGTASTYSDRTGRFLLTGLTPGHHVLMVDGRSASRGEKTYGIFKIGVEIAVNRTNALSFNIWMPRLDTRNTITVSAPTTKDTAITTPHIPGLEVHIPSGAIVRDVDGQTANKISITPIPVDRPPFPLPSSVNVPVFFTVQPGAAQVIPPRARVIYPNYAGAAPGTRVDFWNYDPAVRGWYVYGKGSVTPDGKQVVPDPGVVIYEFTGFMIGSGGNPAGNGPNDGSGADAGDGDPVDLGTGLFVLKKTDIYLPDTVPIILRRTYRPGDNAARAFGIGSTHPYDIFLWSVNNYQETDLILPDGGRIHYVRISPGTGYSDAVYEHTTTPGVFYKSRISWNGNGWDLKLKDGTVFVFPDFSPLKSIRDRYGNQLTITRSGGNSGNITQLTSPNGRWLQFTYDTGNRVSQAKDNTGRTVNYTYDPSGRLATVTDPNGGITQYTYDASNRMLTIRDARNIVFLTNQYDGSGRVTLQTQADGSTYQFAYSVDGNGKITQTDVTDPRGTVRRATFNSNGYLTSNTKALGLPEQQTRTYERQAGTNLVLSVLDPMSRKTALTYDVMGNATSITRLADTAQAVSTAYTYEPLYNQLSSVTDPLGHTTVYGRDFKGSLTTITDQLGNQSTMGYNNAGQVVSITDALQNTSQLTYDGGDLVAITNPLGKKVNRFIDAAGRLAAITSALGTLTRYDYDSLGQRTRITNPLQGTTVLSYDANGNPSSVTDANGNVTSYIYNNMDRLLTRRNPLLQDENYQYDLNGNRTQVTDQKGQVTTYAYDALNRLTQITYADNSTSTFTYNAANRVTQAADSVGGTISYTYDNLDRVTSQTTPLGTVSYTYDAAGRRTSMTVAGQSPINYSYDNANHLTQITRGSSTVTFAYDANGRRTSLTLPNGVVTQYTYDNASRMTAITYQRNSVTLGNLTYEHDAVGRRTKIGGSYARTSLPQSLASSTHNARNQLTQRGAQTLTYDANGNLLSDGVTTYTWNARNQLISTSGPGAASFQYDVFGRRIAKTVAGSSVNYLYDGRNVIQELAGTTPSANMLTAAIDEVFSRTDSSASFCLLTAGLNSVIGLTDSSGVEQTQYSYEPFGATTLTGAANANSFQYTSRENDLTGLYYYRARYYSPMLQRFISEDPIGFSSGDTNLYAYVGNDPINLSDPRGLQQEERRPGEPVRPPEVSPGEIVRSHVVEGIAEHAGGPISGPLLGVAGGLGDVAPGVFYIVEKKNQDLRDQRDICCQMKMGCCSDFPPAPPDPNNPDPSSPTGPGGSGGGNGGTPGGPGRKNQ